MDKALAKLSDWHLLVLYRIAKKRIRPFFAHPKTMIALRTEVERRGLTLGGNS